MATETANNKPTGVFHDALTCETIERELTAEEIAALPQPEASNDAD